MTFATEVLSAAYARTLCRTTHGVNWAGNEFGSATVPVVPDAAELSRLAARGVEMLRVPFRFRPQMLPGSPEFARWLTDVDAACASAGVVWSLDWHEYSFTRGPAAPPLGAPGGQTITEFADSWYVIALQSDMCRALIGYGIQNEPNMSGPRTLTQNQQWHMYAKAASAAIRDVRPGALCFVGGVGASPLGSFGSAVAGWQVGHNEVPNPTTVPEVHFYLDTDGTYRTSYASELTKYSGYGGLTDPAGGPQFTDLLHKAKTLALRGFLANVRTPGVKHAYIGEWGIPRTGTDAAKWDAAMTRMMDELIKWQQANEDVLVHTTCWAAGPWSSGYALNAYPTSGEQTTAATLISRLTYRPTSTGTP